METTVDAPELEWHEQQGIRMQEPEPVVLCFCGMDVPLSDWETHVVQEGPFRELTYSEPGEAPTLTTSRRGPLDTLESDLIMLQRLYRLQFRTDPTVVTLGRNDYMHLAYKMRSYAVNRLPVGTQVAYYAGMRLQLGIWNSPFLSSPFLSLGRHG